MRFLVTEKPYETPLAAGSLTYSQSEMRIGVTEQWRITAAPDDFTIVRVDLDMRPFNQRSYLFHLVLDGDQRPERLVYRYLGSVKGEELSGNLTFADGVIVNRQTAQGETNVTETDALPLLIPGTVGLSLLAQDRPQTAASLNIFTNANTLPLVQLPLTYQPQRTRNLIPIKAGSTVFTTTWLQIAFIGWTHTVWRDKQGYPVQMERSDGVAALDTRPMRFQR